MNTDMQNNDSTILSGVSDKAAFQDAVKKIESELTAYKKSFPKNFGEGIKSKLSPMCLAYAVYCFVICGVSNTHFHAMMAAFVTIPMLLCAYFLRYKPAENNRDTINQIRQSLKKYEDYPDVQKYAAELDIELTRSEAEKNGYKNKANIVFYIFIAVLVGLMVSEFF